MKKYLFLPGGLLLAGALMRAAFVARWDTPAVALASGGALALAIGIGANWQGVREWFRDPRGVFVLNSLLSTLLLVAILGLVNAVASQRGWQADVTMAGRNTLAAETRTGLERLARDVAVKQFGQSRDAAVDELLSAFANASNRVRVSFADVDRSPQEARGYGVKRDGTVVVVAGSRWRKVERPTEPALFQAIVQVTADREPGVCVATGDGERGADDQGASGMSQWSDALKAAGYRVARVSLQQTVETACEVLFVAGPSAGLSVDALVRLDAYLGRGGRLALLVDPPVVDPLRPWLAARGIEAGEGVIVETNPAGRQVGAGPESPLALAYFAHPITRGFELAVIFDRAVPLSVRAQPQIGLPVPLAGTGDGAFERRPPAVEGVEFRDGVDRKGPFLLAAASTMPRGLTDDRNVQEGRFVVFGDSDFVTNAYLNRQGNRDLALRVVAWLAGEQEARSVSLGDRQNRRTALTERTRTWMYVVNLGLLPLLPLVAGIVQLIRAKR